MSPEPCTTLRCEEDAWTQRAKAAKWAAEELDACARAVSGILSTNYLGDGCLEAPPVFTDLTNAISTGPSSWRTGLTYQAEALSQAASSCRAAGTIFNATDSSEAERFEK